MHARVWAAGPKGQGRAGRPELVGEVLAGAAARTPGTEGPGREGRRGQALLRAAPRLSVFLSPGAVGLSLDPVTHGELAAGWGERLVLSPVTRRSGREGTQYSRGPRRHSAARPRNE